MMRRAAIVLALSGAAATVASFFLPTDFAWNGPNAFKSCIATSHYASGLGARMVWLGFAAASLYPYVWATAAGVGAVMEWRGRSRVAPYIPATVNAAGGVLVAILGMSLILMREAWPAPSAQRIAAAGAIVHLGILWGVFPRVSPERRTASVMLVGAIPFLALQVALGISSWRYGNPAWGFGLAAAGLLAIIAAAALLFAAVERGDNVRTEVGQ